MKVGLIDAERSSEELELLEVHYELQSELYGIVRCIAIDVIKRMLKKRKDVEILRFLSRNNETFIAQVKPTTLRSIKARVFW